MKIALSIWNGRIAPVFDVSQTLLIFEIDQGVVAAKSELVFQANEPAMTRAARLSGLGVEILVCGAISSRWEDVFHGCRIKTVSFIAGGVDEVLQAFLQNSLSDPGLRMPGCCQRRQRHRRGRCRAVEKNGM